jgi:hypothetical protein
VEAERRAALPPVLGRFSSLGQLFFVWPVRPTSFILKELTKQGVLSSYAKVMTSAQYGRGFTGSAPILPSTTRYDATQLLTFWVAVWAAGISSRPAATN